MSDLKAAYNIVANALERDNTPARSEISKLLQEAVGDALDEIETLRARVAELEAVELGILVRLYNTGYHQGHHDTVEGGYTHVYPADMDSYHDDVVSEWLDDQDDYTAPQPVKVPESKGYEDAPDTTLHTDTDEAWADGWNACREAMLAAQED